MIMTKSNFYYADLIDSGQWERSRWRAYEVGDLSSPCIIIGKNYFSSLPLQLQTVFKAPLISADDFAGASVNRRFKLGCVLQIRDESSVISQISRQNRSSDCIQEVHPEQRTMICRGRDLRAQYIRKLGSDNFDVACRRAKFHVRLRTTAVTSRCIHQLAGRRVWNARNSDLNLTALAIWWVASEVVWTWALWPGSAIQE
jgi:hypothetical protein